MIITQFYISGDCPMPESVQTTFVFINPRDIKWGNNHFDPKEAYFTTQRNIFHGYKTHHV